MKKNIQAKRVTHKIDKTEIKTNQYRRVREEINKIIIKNLVNKTNDTIIDICVRHI